MKIMEKLNLAQAISLLESEQNFGSIYTKEDVLNLLNRIENVPCGTLDIEELIEDLENDIHSIIDNLSASDIVDFDSAEFSLDGCTIELSDIEIRTYNFKDELSSIVSNLKEKYSKED